MMKNTRIARRITRTATPTPIPAAAPELGWEDEDEFESEEMDVDAEVGGCVTEETPEDDNVVSVDEEVLDVEAEEVVKAE